MKTCMFGMIVWMLTLHSPALSGAEVFQWTDSRGIIHMTDNLHSVPEPLRNSPTLMIRQDLDLKTSPGAADYPEIASEEPLSRPKAPEAANPSEPELKTAAPPNIHYSVQQQTTIVVVNSVVRHPRKHSCPGSEGCQGVFRPNFDDRRYVHPGVFNGGARQYIQPR